MAKASDYDPEILKLFDGYVHGKITRREFLDRAAAFAAVGASAGAILASLSPNYALARQVDPDDPSISVSYKKYASPDGAGVMRAYLARPAIIEHKLPAVVVIHENRGLNPYIEDVTRRLAIAGFIGFAGKVGSVGFCFGGGMSMYLAVRISSLAAAVAFYGRHPAAEDAPKIRAPLMIHHGALDERVNAGWPDFEQALQAAGSTYEQFMYADANHGFHNDTTPRYDSEAAKLAWQRSIAFFEKNLA
jgi:carboxymethylenebutenolidase